MTVSSSSSSSSSPPPPRVCVCVCVKQMKGCNFLICLALCFVFVSLFLRCACAGNYIYLLFMKNRRGTPPPTAPFCATCRRFCVPPFISFASFCTQANHKRDQLSLCWWLLRCVCESARACGCVCVCV